MTARIVETHRAGLVPRSRILRFAVLLLAGTLAAFTGSARAQDEARPPRIEVSFGLGGAKASEPDIFNLPLDEKSKPGLLLDFRVRQNFSTAMAFGFHIYGTTETTPKYVLTDNLGNISTADFDLTVLHLGVDVRYQFLPPPVQPYVDFGVSYVAGSVEDRTLGSLQINGGSVGGGPGVHFLLNRFLGIGVQGLFTAGTAKWEKLPFPALSRGRDYQPGFAGVEGFLTYRLTR